jgi:tripartite-type tricarboxylate transporter receptor subunit TctC
MLGLVQTKPNKGGGRDDHAQKHDCITAPAAVPAAIRERLGAEVVAALNDPAIAQRVRDYGAEPWPLGPADYDAFMRREVEIWAPVVRASGAQID